VRAQEDLSTLLKTQVLFWMLAAPDGHAKNFSLRVLPEGRYALTPLYDVMSIWPVEGRGANRFSWHKGRLAMAVWGKRKHDRLREVQRRHFNGTAARFFQRPDAEDVIEEVLAGTPAAIDSVANRAGRAVDLHGPARIGGDAGADAEGIASVALRRHTLAAFTHPRRLAPTTPVDLAALLGRVGLGDRAAFAVLYRTTSAHLFGVILRINGNRGQAEDVLQETFVNVWRSAGAFDAARAQPMTWLTSIARNGAIDSLRRAKARVATVSSHVGSADDGDEADLAEQAPSADAGPLELLQQAAEKRDVQRCVGRLSAEQQQCIALAYYQGLSHSEVAEHLAQPLGTVKSWLRRALQTLKDCLAQAAGQAH
jgi:RNA polymerase sigma-70 factor (ECF subfamily)